MSKDKDSFMDDLFSSKPSNKPSSNSPAKKKDFVLDTKYKKVENDNIFDSDSVAPRRRRGNPTLASQSDIKDDLLQQKPKTESVPIETKPSNTSENQNPFPWMQTTSQVTNNVPNNSNQINPLPPKQDQQLSTPANQTSTMSATSVSSAPTVHQLKPAPMIVTHDMIVNDVNQDVFNQEVENQTRLLNERKAEYAANLEKQRLQITEHFEKLHQKQSQVW